jgi:hypothetical protein
VKILLRHVAGRLVAVIMVMMMFGSGSLGLCWCTALENHECDNQATAHIQLAAVDDGCCNCELCNCCGQGVIALVDMTVSHQVPLLRMAFMPSHEELRLHNLADDIFIPPKITA